MPDVFVNDVLIPHSTLRTPKSLDHFPARQHPILPLQTPRIRSRRQIPHIQHRPFAQHIYPSDHPPQRIPQHKTIRPSGQARCLQLQPLPHRIGPYLHCKIGYFCTAAHELHLCGGGSAATVCIGHSDRVDGWRQAADGHRAAAVAPRVGVRGCAAADIGRGNPVGALYGTSRHGQDAGLQQSWIAEGEGESGRAAIKICGSDGVHAWPDAREQRITAACGRPEVLEGRFAVHGRSADHGIGSTEAGNGFTVHHEGDVSLLGDGHLGGVVAAVVVSYRDVVVSGGQHGAQAVGGGIFP